jgi:type IV pilus assembly protein PilM
LIPQYFHLEQSLKVNNMSVGLDIGSKTIKIVELKPDGQGWQLAASGISGYDGQTPDNLNEPREFSEFGSMIRKLYKAAGVSSKEINVALPESLVFTRTLKFPLLTDAEIASAIKWESEQYIPIPISEAIIQHQIIGRKENSTPPEALVLLVAAPRILTEKYVKAASEAGLNVVSVESDLIALSRALSQEGKTLLLVDFGARSTDVAISRGGQMAFSRSIPTAGDAFTRAVSQGLGVQVSQAEQYKKTYGLKGEKLEGKIQNALSPVFKIVADEIKKAIHFYIADEGGDSPSAVIVSGGTAGMPYAINELSKYLGLEVVVANPFANIKVDPEAAKTIAPYAPLYSIAVGLAMKKG